MQWKSNAAEVALRATTSDFEKRIVQHVLEIRRNDANYYSKIDDDFTSFMELVKVHEDEEVPTEYADQYAADAGFIIQHLDDILKAYSYKAATQATLGRSHVQKVQKQQPPVEIRPKL